MGASAHRATQSTRPADVVRQWFVVDATDAVLGRLATRFGRGLLLLGLFFLASCSQKPSTSPTPKTYHLPYT